MNAIPLAALEVWRASGPRTYERLRSLVQHFAEINAQSAYGPDYVTQALAAVREWEWMDCEKPDALEPTP